MWLQREHSKTKHDPDVEFVAPYALTACVGRLEALADSESTTTSGLTIHVDPIDSQTWVFQARKSSLHKNMANKMIVGVRGYLLRKGEISTLVIIRCYVSEETAQQANGLFVIFLLVVLGTMSLFISAKSLVSAIFIGAITLLPLFNWRFIAFTSQSRTQRRRLQQLIKHVLE